MLPSGRATPVAWRRGPRPHGNCLATSQESLRVDREAGSVTTATPEARLLVVDDEPNIVDLLATSLRFAGFEVATARNGSEELREGPDFRPDLLGLDVMVPGIYGVYVWGWI